SRAGRRAPDLPRRGDGRGGHPRLLPRQARGVWRLLPHHRLLADQEHAQGRRRRRAGDDQGRVVPRGHLHQGIARRPDGAQGLQPGDVPGRPDRLSHDLRRQSGRGAGSHHRPAQEVTQVHLSEALPGEESSGGTRAMTPTDAPPNVLVELDDETVFLRYDSDHPNQHGIPRAFAERAERGSFYLIIDMAKTPRLTGEANKAGPQTIRTAWFRGVVFLNASALMRMGLKVFHLGLFLTGQKEFPSVYVKSMEEALAAVVELRERAAKEA